MPQQIRPDKALDVELERLYRMKPLERAIAAKDAVEWHRLAMRTLAATRAKAIRQLRDDEGMSMAAIAEALDVSRQQVYRLAENDA